MAHTLTLVYGNTTVAMASGDYRIRQYVPATPEPGASSVTETATILITGSTLAALQADIRAINQMFERARMRQAGKTLVRTFVKFQASGEATTWLSEIYDGRVVMPDGALAGDWANTQLEVAVIWERTPFWEGDTWIAVPLTNGNGTDVTTGINVYNCNDGVGTSPNKRHNYVDIDGVNDLASELPAPVKLRIGVTDYMDKFYMGIQNNLMGLGLVQPWDEMENYTLAGTSDVVNSAASGGEYKQITLAAATEAILAINYDYTNYSGGYHKFFVTLFSMPAMAVKMKVQVCDPDSFTVIDETPWVFVGSDRLMVLGDLRLPPGRSTMPDSGNFMNYRFNLVLYSTAGGTVNLDALYWLPMASHLEIGSTIADLLNTEVLVYEEGLSHKTYKESYNAGKYINNIDVKNGSGLWLYPGVLSRLHLLMTEVSLGAGINDYVTMTMWYKPRRVTL